MLLTRLYLRNFRVYEEELDLAVPHGLVGIYGPNGAGKSTLLEAITFTLWGRARTGREEIRSAGVGADCVTEVEFEHEGHLYLVRRTLSGINSTMRAVAHCDGLTMAEGATDVRRYVQSVLGMDDAAFRASVFAEQKQLAAFSSQTPAERRRLVLQLLGITPLDGARDAARKDAREAEGELTRLRGMLPDLAALETGAADADAAAAAQDAVAAVEATVAERADGLRTEAVAAFGRADLRRQEHERAEAEVRLTEAALDQAVRRRAELRGELGELDGAAAELAGLQDRLEDPGAARTVLDALRALAGIDRRLGGAEPRPEPALPDPAVRDRLAGASAAAATARDAATGTLVAAREDLRRAQEAAARSDGLSADGACPLCGQALGDAFAAVRAHREAEVERARTAVAEREAACRQLTGDAEAATAALAEAAASLEAATSARRSWEQEAARRAELATERARAVATVVDAGGPAADTLDPASVVAVGTAWRSRVDRAEELQARVLALRTRLERRAGLEAGLSAVAAELEAAATAVEQRRAHLAAVRHDPADLESAAKVRAEAETEARRTRLRADAAALEAVRLRTVADGEARRLADARDQHARLAELESRSRHLSRLAVLLSEFRNTVVASVGPRLAAQAAELFAELTDREYDQLEVDPDTYELQIRDAGRSYGLDRFSGSEIDLANLALRVAISEHIRFQSGGSVGLLVLDEVFGPLDEDRKARMLQALERLKGRFRQVLVVTHDLSVKEQLPNAIEVEKRPGRRAGAHVTGD